MSKFQFNMRQLLFAMFVVAFGFSCLAVAVKSFGAKLVLDKVFPISLVLALLLVFKLMPEEATVGRLGASAYSFYLVCVIATTAVVTIILHAFLAAVIS